MLMLKYRKLLKKWYRVSRHKKILICDRKHVKVSHFFLQKDNKVLSKILSEINSIRD